MKVLSIPFAIAISATAVSAFKPLSDLGIPRGGVIIDRVLDATVEKRIDANPDLSRETKLILKELNCAVTQAAALSLPELFVNQIKDNFVGDNERLITENVSLGWKKTKGLGWMSTFHKSMVQEHDICKIWSTSILKKDDLSDNQQDQSFQAGVLRKLINDPILVPIDDSDFVFADLAQAARVSKDLKLVAGEASPITYNNDFNMQTDESFSRIFFQGIAAPLVAHTDTISDDKELGLIMVDMSFMKDLQVRDDRYKKYGAKVYFDVNQKVKGIYDCDEGRLYTPGEVGWEEAKMQAKVSAFTLCTIREHLSQTHLMVANEASREVVRCLHPEHPIRRLLAIFTYNSVSVNQNAFVLLVPNRSLIQRGTPLEYEGGIQTVFENAVKESIAFKPFPDREVTNPAVRSLNTKGRITFPYLTEGCEYYGIIKAMVSEWLDNADEEASDEYALNFYDAMKETTKHQAYKLPKYSKKSMVELISTIIFTVTGYHELIGSVTDYTDTPEKAGLRIGKNTGQTQVDVQSYIIMAIITASTSLPAPQLMAEFPNYIGAGGAPEWERDVWNKYLLNMGLQAKKVQEDDREREPSEFKYYDPSLFECSVSV